MSRESQNEGIPTKWLNTLTNINIEIPQGWPLMDYALAPYVFGDLLKHEVTWEGLYMQDLSHSQNELFKRKGNFHHRIHGIKREVTDQDIQMLWWRAKENIFRMGYKILQWSGDLLDLEKLTLEDQIRDLDASYGSPMFMVRLGAVSSISEKAADSIITPETQEAITLHKFLSVTDLSYAICAQEALSPVYEAVANVVSSEVTRLEKVRRFHIPSAVSNWWG